MRIIIPARFEKKAGKLDPKIQSAFRERVRLFQAEPHHPLLHNHALHGKRKHQRSINITADWRLIYEPMSRNTVRLIDIDTHTNLYE